MALARSVSHQCSKVSRTPCITPASRASSPRRAMLCLVIINCSTSAPPKSPTTTGTTLIPSQRYNWPNVKRWMLLCGSSPTIASRKPNAAIMNPLTRFRPASDTMKLRPSTVSIRNSGGPSCSTTGRITGTETASTAAPSSAPTNEMNSTAPSARPPSPRRVIG